MLEVVQKKGDPTMLDGRITVYAMIEMDPSDMSAVKHPIASMIHNGLLVAQGNFKDQSSLKDFLKSELGVSLDEDFNEGLAQLLEKMDGLEGALDPQKLRDRLENMGEIEDILPTPAKIVPFHSEDEILMQEGDVFFAGNFKKIGNAVYSINAIPILYQARFKEQEINKVRNEIEQLISQLERTEAPRLTYMMVENVEEKLLKEFIPNMLYSRNDKPSYTTAEKQFRSFMNGYRYKEDIDAVVSIIGTSAELTPRESKLLELFARKIASVKNEDFATADAILKEIERLREQS